MTTPFRDETEGLRAHIAHLEAEIERLMAKPAKVPTQWGVVDWSGSDNIAVVSSKIGMAIALLYAIVCVVTFVVDGHVPFSWPMEQRALFVSLILGAVWCLAFLRRVPR